MSTMFFWAGIFQLVGMLVLVLIVVLCVLAIVRAVFVPADLRRATTCGGCGHEISSVEPGRCPECGAFLVKVGIITPGLAVRQRGSMLAAIVGWTILSFMGGVVAFWIVAAMTTFSSGSMSMQITSNNTFRPSRTWDPQTNSYADTPDYSLAFNVDAVTDPGGRAESGEITVRMNGPGRAVAVLTVDVQTAEYTVLDDQDNEIDAGADFDDEAARTLYETGGVDIGDDAALQTQAGQLVELVDNALRDPNNYEMAVLYSQPSPQSGLTSSGGSSSSSSYSPAMGGGSLIAVGILGGTAVVYVGGLAWMTWRRRRLLGISHG